MSMELVKALLTIVKTCANAPGCDSCQLQDFCGKIPSEW